MSQGEKTCEKNWLIINKVVLLSVIGVRKRELGQEVIIYIDYIEHKYTTVSIDYRS